MKWVRGSKRSVAPTQGRKKQREAGPKGSPAHPVTSPFKSEVTSLNHAMYIASDVYRNRKNYDQERENPLPKLFHDKREDKSSNNQVE